MTARLIGRSFIHPVADYLLIGGAASLIVFAALLAIPGSDALASSALVAWLVLLSNSAHFASSTVRLYTKPNAFTDLPFLTMGLPLVTLGLLALSLQFADTIGYHLQALYLTWSPYHYAAQAYGLSVMYCYRSGCALAADEKRLLWWVCMLPFFHTFLFGQGTGLNWLLPDAARAATPDAAVSVIMALHAALPVIGFLAPLALFAKLWQSKTGTMPLISLLIIVSNGVWWFLMMPIDAFIWSSIFHGIQYLSIVLIFHYRDQSKADGDRSWLYHVATFYGACLLLGYGLFNCLPLAGSLFGYGPVESLILVAALINIHHFYVDGYIWRLKKSDSNRRIVDRAAALLTGAG